mmetsp:Transcript_94188/g.304804  ORF Transcript_94188/g.304804 Transcript_94188/m.304804 type:complete len:141 (+) Transcript_94188:596-1018(+)
MLALVQRISACIRTALLRLKPNYFTWTSLACHALPYWCSLLASWNGGPFQQVTSGAQTRMMAADAACRRMAVPLFRTELAKLWRSWRAAFRGRGGIGQCDWAALVLSTAGAVFKGPGLGEALRGYRALRLLQQLSADADH